MNPTEPLTVPREYRLDPGDLIAVKGPNELVPIGQQVAAEVHEVIMGKGGVFYKVRILSSSTAATAPVGSFHTIEHQYADQCGVTHTDSLTDLFNDPRVIKYMDPRARGRLAQVAQKYKDSHSSVRGTMAVTATVFGEILRNRELGEPPLRPERGERGHVTWMVATGDPAVGRSVEAKKKTLEVRTFTGVPMGQLPVITTADLELRVQWAQRLRYANLSKEADEFLANEAKLAERKKTSKRKQAPYLDPQEAEEVANLVREFAVAHAEALAAPKDSTLGELLDANAALATSLREHLGSERPANQFLRFVTNEQAVQAIMWRTLGTYVASLPAQAAFVDFTDSPLSQKHSGEYRNGSYLVVASRRFMYVLRADGEFV